MKLFLLTSLTMVAFAANSVLNRFALADGAIDPASFAALRVTSGALVLWGLVVLRQRKWALWSSKRPAGALALSTYMVGFSFAYISLGAAVGALILFGGVQVVMFAGALLSRERLGALQALGAVIAFGGLVWLLWPSGGTAPDLLGAGLMIAAAIGWGVYSLLGRRSTDPTGDTAANFIFAVPLALLTLFATLPPIITPTGISLAITSGVVMSGLGYALWYSVLPRLTSATAAIAQLSVPVIAALGGITVLGEAVSLRFLIASALVLGGIAISLVPRRVKI
jgi:drug/metabolite transporter (DMT)-like permease